MTIISPLYQKDIYSIELFIGSIAEIKALTQANIITLIEAKDNMELIKKITEYYLNYVAINYSDRISNHHYIYHIVRSYNNLHVLEESIGQSHELLSKSSNKMKAIKSHLIISSAKLALKHNKVVNLKSMLKFLRDTLMTQISSLDQLKLNNFEYLNYYKKNIAIQNSLSRISSEYPMIAIIDLMKARCREMNERFTKRFLNDIELVFDKPTSHIYDLFCLYAINSQVGLSQESLHSFSAKLLKCYKVKIKDLIKQTFFIYAEEKVNFTYESMISIKDIKKLKYEEAKFLEGFKVTLVHLKELNEMYISYTQIEEKYITIYNK